MANLTGNIVEEVTEVKPLPGRALVVYERVGVTGRKFVDVIAPEKEFDTEKPRWLERMLERFRANRPLYAVYAVNTDKHLEMDFQRRLLHRRNQKKSFVLKFALEYYVSEPRLLVTSFVQPTDNDPLKRIQDRIEAVIGGAVAREEWELVRDRFDFAEKEAVNVGLPNVIELAAALGIAIRPDTVSLTCILPEGEKLIEHLAEQTEREKQKRTLEHEAFTHGKGLEYEREKADQLHQDDLEALKLDQKVKRIGDEEILVNAGIRKRAKEAAVRGLEIGVERAAGNVDSATSLAGAMREFRNVFSEGAQPQGAATGPDSLKAAASLGYLSAPAAELGPVQKLHEITTKLLGLVAQVNGQPDEKRRLLSALLHVVAEAVLSEDEDEAIKAHGECLKDALVELSLTPEQNDSLIKFLNYRALKEYLK